MYEYNYNQEKCWYKKSCVWYNTEHCNSNCIRYMEMDYLMEMSQLPKSVQFKNELIAEKVDLKNFKFLNELKNDIVNFVKNGESLYIFSQNLGNGKTSWAIKLMQAYFNKIWAGNGFVQRGLFIHTPSFITKFKEIINKKDENFEELKKQILEVDLVIWDDIAANRLSDYDHTNLLTYIDQRKLNGSANIFTGNLDESELVSALGNRLKSRIWNDSTIVELFGKDRREG